MPRLPNLHLVATWHSPDDAIRKKHTQHDTSQVLPRKMTMDTSCCPCHENCSTSSENVVKVLRLPHKTTFDTLQNTSECHATPATRNEATLRLKPPKTTPSAELTIGTAIWPSRGRLRTVADGCGRLRTVANGWATSSEHTLNPQTPRVKREPLLRIRELWENYGKMMFGKKKGEFWDTDVQTKELPTSKIIQVGKIIVLYLSSPYFMVQKQITPEGVISFLIVYCCGSHIMAAFINIVEGKLTLINFWSRNWMHELRRNTGGLELWSA